MFFHIIEEIFNNRTKKDHYKQKYKESFFLKKKRVCVWGGAGEEPSLLIKSE